MQRVGSGGEVEAFLGPFDERGDRDGARDGGPEVGERRHPAAEGAEVQRLVGEDVVEGEVVRVGSCRGVVCVCVSVGGVKGGVSWSLRVEFFFFFFRRRCHLPINQSINESINHSIKLTDEQDQQRAQARVERRLDRDDLRDDQPRVPLELAPPHGVAEAKKGKENEQRKDREQSIGLFFFCLKSFVSF